jgi:hypothetical protein
MGVVREELTAKEVADRLGIHPTTVIQMGDEGILEMADRSAVAPSRRRRRNPRFFTDDVAAYLESGGTVESRRRSRAS